MNIVAEQQRRRPREPCTPETERKRVCRSQETVSEKIIVCHPPSKCTMNSWDIEENLKQKDPSEIFNPQSIKEKPNYVIIPNKETRTGAQPCPRCIAGEPGHFGHIMDLQMITGHCTW
ncbi:uncharacterized protein C10orf143 homolog [Varanus komodoensis]|uniref:uncharacterized protein C10orf143 homolog n=1 Tax=Varanus komodoensis TaxID=61221 RepID=UPI001CF77512|nr:uncharacterized protein C10orf143 homolog [Varanus komodoensis]